MSEEFPHTGEDPFAPDPRAPVAPPGPHTEPEAALDDTTEVAPPEPGPRRRQRSMPKREK